MKKILLILTMEHSIEVAKNLASLGHKISILTLNPNLPHTKNISGLINKNINDKKIFENVFFENDVRLKKISTNLKNYLNKSNSRIGFCLSWHWLIDKNFLNKFKNGLFGWHGSMFRLPNGFGRSPMNWSIRLGGDQIIHTCFKYTSIVDNGPIYIEKKFKINKFDHIDNLLQKSVKLIINDIKFLIKIKNILNLPSKRVRINNPLRFEKLDDKSGEIFFDGKELKEISNLIRSCSNPFPCAFIRTKKNNKIRIRRVIKKKIKGCLIIKKNKQKLYCLIKQSSKNIPKDLLDYKNGYKISLAK